MGNFSASARKWIHLRKILDLCLVIFHYGMPPWMNETHWSIFIFTYFSLMAIARSLKKEANFSKGTCHQCTSILLASWSKWISVAKSFKISIQYVLIQFNKRAYRLPYYLAWWNYTADGYKIICSKALFGRHASHVLTHMLRWDKTVWSNYLFFSATVYQFFSHDKQN